MANQLSYEDILDKCKDLFLQKYQEYGDSWRILRAISLFDQIYIKAYRIRTIQEKGGVQLVADSVYEDLIGIINYAIFGLILENEKEYLPEQSDKNLPQRNTLQAYDEELKRCRELYNRKNHDYGNIWQELSMKTCVDFILMKVQRMRAMLNGKGPIVSEGYRANYLDIINYAVFAYLLNLCEHSS